MKIRKNKKHLTEKKVNKKNISKPLINNSYNNIQKKIILKILMKN